MKEAVEWLVEKEFLGVDVNGKKQRVVARIGKPYREDPHFWRCPVSLEGLIETVHLTGGTDQLQSLALALRLVVRQLHTFTKLGGKLFIDEQDPIEPTEVKHPHVRYPVEDVFDKIFAGISSTDLQT